MSLKKLALGFLLAFGLGAPVFATGVQLWSNNAVTTLAAPATSTATSITVSSSSLFPAPTGGNWFVATLEHIVSGVVTVNEIVQVTAVSGTTWTVVRAQEGTGAVAWLSGDTVALLPTAGGLNQFTQPGAVNGDCTLNSSFSIACTKTGGVALGTFATQNYATPPVIGGTTPNVGYFTTLKSNGISVAPATGSFTATLTGMSATTTGTIYYSQSGNIVTLDLGATQIIGTSNSSSMLLTGLPSNLQPVNSTYNLIVPCTNNSNNNYACVVFLGVDSGEPAGTVGFGVCTFGTNCSPSGFTASGNKGLGVGWSITYSVR